MKHSINNQGMPGLLPEVDDVDINEQPLFEAKCRRSWNYFLYISAGLGLVALLLFCLKTRVPFSVFSRDPLALTEGKPYYGFLSNIGILFWSGTVAICSFVCIVAYAVKRSVATVKFLAFSAGVSLMLLLDDLFMLHEYVFPKMLEVRQRYVVAAYLLITLAYVIRFRGVIWGKHSANLLAAFGFFAFSLGIDTFMHNTDTWQYFFEDGAKFLGIVCWFNYFQHQCKDEILLLSKPGVGDQHTAKI